MTTSKDISQLNFLTFKNRGHTYVRAYRNVWVPKKVNEKEGTVVLGPEVKNFLPYFALATLAQQNGLMDALTAIFGKDDTIRWRDYAIYQVLLGGSADCFEYWAMDQYLPKISAKMDGFGTRLRRTGALSKDRQINRAYRDRRALLYQLLVAAQVHCAKTRRGGSRSLVHREPPALGAGYAFRPDPEYISNRVALNKLALAMVENYHYWLWESGKTGEVLSIKSVMRHCQNFYNALSCLAWSQGFV